MKIKADVLKKFLEQLKMEGSTSVGEIILNFAKDGLRGKAMVAAKTVYIDARLKANAFDSYQAIGTVGIRDLGILITYLSNSVGIVDIKNKDNKIVISTTDRVVKVTPVALEYVEKAPDGVIKKLLPEIKDYKFDIDVSNIKSFFNDVRAIGTSQFNMLGKNGDTLLMKAAVEDSVTQTYKLPVPDFTLDLGTNFIDSISKLEGNITVYVKNDKPILIHKKDDLVDIAIIVVPLIDK